MSLKDPYSYMKVSRPVRSKLCKHQRCFDATWWIEQNVTHPEWLCPLCNKELNFGDLMVDG
jgi:E3 SUMO-protein ligase PIAS1